MCSLEAENPQLPLLHIYIILNLNHPVSYNNSFYQNVVLLGQPSPGRAATSHKTAASWAAEGRDTGGI